MNRLILIFILFQCAHSQAVSQESNSKGTTGVITGGKVKAGPTRALIIGVSNYKDKDIPDLQYAHVDATAYAEFLKTPAGGKVPENNIRLLTNEAATGGKVRAGLDWISRAAQKHDQCIIYFSGHGDVESVHEAEPGHFLVHDSPSENYQLNSLRIADLKKVISRLTDTIGAKVLVVTDACRSGNLAGTANKGAQATAAAFMQQFYNEVKIMSCQANELSVEGSQWGGGRGMFSYHLINGLTGLADANNNKEINLKEINRYLEDRFEEDLLNERQTPVISGDRKAVISRVYNAQLDSLLSTDNEAIAGQATASKSGNEADKIIKLFYEAISDNRLISNDVVSTSGQTSATSYLDLLMIDHAQDVRVALARGDLIASLQDSSQHAINLYLSLDPDEINRRWFSDGSGYTKYVAYLGKAAELLGESHYLYPQMKSKELYFSVVNKRISLDRQKADPAAYALLMPELELALRYEPRAAYINNEMGLLLERTGKYSQAILQYTIAIELSPEWALPYNNIGYSHYLDGDLDKAEVWYHTALEKAQLYVTHGNLKNLYIDRSDYKTALKHVNANLDVYPTDLKYLNNAGYLKYKLKDYSAAINYLNMAIDLDATKKLPYINLADVYKEQGEYDNLLVQIRALEGLGQDLSLVDLYYGYYYKGIEDVEKTIKHFRKYVDREPIAYERNELALAFLQTSQFKLAQSELRYYLEEVNPSYKWAYFDYACAAVMLGDLDEFKEYMTRAIANGFDSKKEMEESSYLSSIRQHPYYLELIVLLD